MLEIQNLRQHINNKWLSNCAVNAFDIVWNWLGHLVLGFQTFLIPCFSEVHMTAVLVLGVKLDSGSACRDMIIIPSYIATYHLIQKLLSATSIQTLYNNTACLILLMTGKWATKSESLGFLCCWLINQLFC
jgi:hypothetical protein